MTVRWMAVIAGALLLGCVIALRLFTAPGGGVACWSAETCVQRTYEHHAPKD